MELGARPPGSDEWRSRGYLPHFDAPGLVQSITFRLDDALPAEVVAHLKHEHGGQPDSVKRQRLEAYLDAGHGCCHLLIPKVARLVEDALLHFDGRRYRLLEWVLMPNHVHVLVETLEGYPLSGVVQSWKSFTAKEANRLLGREGAFWQPEYFDRAIRDERHLSAVTRYIRGNPVIAGLVTAESSWLFGSARRRLGVSE